MKRKSKIVLFILLFLSLISFYYADVNSNIRQGMNFWKALFEGQFFNYYTINYIDQEANLMLHNANYDMLMNFFMGIWQLPLYVFEKVLGLNNILEYFPARVYGKLYYLCLLYLAGYSLKKLGKEIGLDEKRQDMLFFMFCSSSMVILSVCNVTQADIIAIVFIILSLIFLLRGDKKWFLFFIIACQCKNFAFFIFVPIILLKEKNIFKIVFYAIFPWCIQFLIDIPFQILDVAGVASKTGRMSEMMASMVKNKVEVFGADIPIVFITYILICIFAYIKDLDNSEKNKYYIYFGALGIVGFFACFEMFCYWGIYLVPLFLLILFINHKENEKEIILEMVATNMFALGSVLTQHWIFEYDVMGNMLVDRILPFKKFELHGLTMLFGYLSRDEMRSIWTITYAVFVAWLIYFFVDNRPSKKTEVLVEKGGNLETLLWIRALLGLAICNITIIFYAITVAKRAIEVIFFGE